MEIVSRTPCTDCKTLPDAPYETLRGRATFALDPNAPANARIVDLKNAPRDARGRVVFSTDFTVLRPVHAVDSTLLYDVSNRGEPITRGLDYALDPKGARFENTGFLERHGFTVVASAWGWDVASGARGDERLIFQAPVAYGHGGPITGKVANEFTVDKATAETSFAGIEGRAYPMATPDDPAAVLTARHRPDDPRKPLPRSTWRLLPASDGGVPSHIALDGGFRPGTLYELTYMARDPVVVGAGPAGIRDLLAWLRTHPLEGAPPPRRTLLIGISQTGRLIQQMLYEGFDLDEHGQRVFDGALAVVAGAGRGSFDVRFGFPTRAANMVVDRDYPTDIFPFATGPTRDPVTGRTGSLFERAHGADGAAPKLFIVNKSTEFWGRAASLMQTTPDGRADAPQDPAVRLYLLAGMQHFPGGERERGERVNCTDPIMDLPYLRALLINLDEWVKGAIPPPSAYPRLSGGGLVSVAEYDRLFPKINRLTPPMAAFTPLRLDFGPRFTSAGIEDNVPPEQGAPFAVLVPRPDPDGTDAGGLQPVELRAPLGTYTGWNPMGSVTGFGWALDRFQGSFQPFARTEAERRAANDPRPSLEARYPTRAAFLAAARLAAAKAVADRTLLAEDGDGIVSAQGAFYDRILAHPPGDQSCAYLRPKPPKN
ncbi:alpha/beta hydrolase domain-containing protein [Caulobacter sp. S45]|uniref:alpha/beta hydrolase domain-containing protein n=1 Tax=Caulobacter sp. S45 TaxID=1641861 RepID=UPI00131E7D8D|nr:alpha/beta hydrolase domain-containing protein [Caulobacter sp. S45]